MQIRANVYKKEFNSVKILRSHIENIPIPFIDEAAQDKIIAITDKLIAGLSSEETIHVYNELDALIAEIFNLNPSEIEIIKKAVDGENKFLL